MFVRDPSRYSPPVAQKWAHLRAMEWWTWPSYMSQVFVPVLLCICPWPWVIGAVIVATFIWRNGVAWWWLPMSAITLTPWLMLLRFATAPLSAFILWQRHAPWLAIVALLWGFGLGELIVGAVLLVPQRVVGALTPIGRWSQVAVIQNRLLQRLGFPHDDTAGPDADAPEMFDGLRKWMTARSR